LKHPTVEVLAPDDIGAEQQPVEAVRSGFYARWGKAVFDGIICVVLLPIFLLFCLLLILLNPHFNRGPLFYIQPRMGRNCRAFNAIKFRSMIPVDKMTRRADDPLEEERITRLGRVIRQTRIDELPQILNVFRGEMSLIGPRPDYFHHARRFVRVVPEYRKRHSVLPGISGLAQTEQGYVDSIEATRQKVRLDLDYVDRMSFRLDLYIFWRTMMIVCGRKGC
jgi:lipopolysaccharide/colanic/teichoic acid biosynthesis glycosyltransferase